MRRNWIGSIILLIIVALTGLGLATWKRNSIAASNAAAASQPEPMESVTVATAKETSHQQSTTSIGTVTALRYITLENEVAGTVDKVLFTSGQLVQSGTLLITLDVSVENAELKEQEARAELAKSQLERVQSASQRGAISAIEVDRARAELDVAEAQIARTKAVIARKTIRAPFRARAGITDIHVGQYLDEGTKITTLQGVDDFAYVDFAVAQQIAAQLKPGDSVQIYAGNSSQPIVAQIVAFDARIDPTTRNETLRAKINNAENGPTPGSSVRVEVPAGPQQSAVSIPVSALRKGPQGDHVFVVQPDKDGKIRAHMRPVDSGTILGDEVLILKGLNPGEQIAAVGSFKLRDGALIAISPDAPTDPKNGS